MMQWKKHLKYILNSWREDPETIRFLKNQVKFVGFLVKWVMLPCSETYSEESKCIEVKIYPFSRNQEYYWTNNFWNLVRIIYNFLVFSICQHSCLMHPISLFLCLFLNFRFMLLFGWSIYCWNIRMRSFYWWMS